MSAVVELRQYTLKPGMRDTLIALFEREFIESQEAAGCGLPGQFRDADATDRFVWLRGFRDMPARAAALKAFYGGPVWKANREAANDTMIDSDNVLLLRPGSGFDLEGAVRPPPGAPETPQGMLAATVCRFRDRVGDDTGVRLMRDVFPVLGRAGTPVLAWFLTEYAPNNFPALPVREGENVVVWFARHAGAALPESFLSQLLDCPLTLRLRPTARSKLRIAP
jgi:hypothetical protein